MSVEWYKQLPIITMDKEQKRLQREQSKVNKYAVNIYEQIKNPKSSLSKKISKLANKGYSQHVYVDTKLYDISPYGVAKKLNKLFNDTFKFETDDFRIDRIIICWSKT